MIDSFWTKRRIHQLAGGNINLVHRWLEDYAGWVYVRAWYVSSGNDAAAVRLLEQTFLTVARQLNEYCRSEQSMAEILSSVFSQVAAENSITQSTAPIHEQVRITVRKISTQALSETESVWPRLLRLSQQALAMLSRDEQEILVCRYLRMEALADIASKYRWIAADIQSLLYRAHHSFRRMLESLAQVAAPESSRPIPADMALLESNLEKIFRALGPKPIPAPDVLLHLEKEVQAVLIKNKPAGLDITAKMVITCGCVVLVTAVILGGLWLNTSSDKSVLETRTPESTPSQQNDRQTATADLKGEIQHAFDVGTAQDVESLLGILRTGSYPAQIIAAHYLARCGDKSAIDMLDRAAQKWYAENPAEKNPFAEAIAAIENRIRRQMEDAVRQAQAELLTAEKEVTEKKEPDQIIPSVQLEPNNITETTARVEPDVPVQPEQIPPLPDTEAVRPEEEPIVVVWPPESNTPREEPNYPDVENPPQEIPAEELPPDEIPPEEPTNDVGPDF